MTDVYETDLSPKSMAEAAYTAAVAQIAVRHDKTNRNRADDDTMDRGIDICEDEGGANNVSNSRKAGNDIDLGTSIKKIWKSSDIAVDEKLSETVGLLVGELDSLLEFGLGAFNDLDVTMRQLTQAKELAETRSREAQRLQLIDEQSRTSLSSLLRAVESSKVEARDSSRSAQVEARLRTNISTLRDERDKALNDLSDCQRKQSLLEEELRLTKLNLSRVTQEKNSMERYNQTAMSLSRTLDKNNSNTDMNYYKRKVAELSEKLHSQQDIIFKQNSTISELRGQSERSSSTGDKRFRTSY
ncbi:hypothetical protein ACHAWU_004096 [Discostella pseudostelligera]|uniref:Uncharacterized protein n=1 Tax=Discostella pseudostelligera TaxID=259834 RepID=A0ABD3MJR5_9STRA